MISMQTAYRQNANPETMDQINRFDAWHKMKYKADLKT